MLIEALATVGFATVCGVVLFPQKAEEAKETLTKAAKATNEKISASAYTNTGRLVKAYRSQEEARRHRIKLKIGTTIGLPDGTTYTVEEKLEDVESNGWWYAWAPIY